MARSLGLGGRRGAGRATERRPDLEQEGKTGKGKGPIGAPIPIEQLEDELEADPTVETIDEDLDEEPPSLEEDDEEFDEQGEYDGDTDDERDFSEPTADAGADRESEGGGGARAGHTPDLEIEVLKDERGRRTAEVFMPAWGVLARYRGGGRNRELGEFTSHLNRLERIGERFVEEMHGKWDEYFSMRSLPEAGRLFPGLMQVTLAEALRIDPSVISRFREAYSVRLPKFGTVMLGQLFDAAARTELERCHQLVREYLETTPDASKKRSILERIAAEVGRSTRQVRNYLKQLEEEGLFSWPARSKSGGRKDSRRRKRRRSR